MNTSVNVSRFPGPERVQGIIKEVEQARQAIEQAPAADCYQSSGSRTLSKPQGEYVSGQVQHVSWMTAPGKVSATSKHGDVTVELRSETFKKDTSALEAAAAGVGSIFGALLGAAFGGGDSRKSSGSLVAGALLGGLTAWGGVKKTFEGPGESRIQRIETSPTGITTEELVLGADGSSQRYSSKFHRIGAAPVLDDEAAKDYIAHLDLGPLPTKAESL